MSAKWDQNSVLFSEVMTILEEQRALQAKNSALQQRLEELLMTLELKTSSKDSQTSTPQRLTSLVPRLNKLDSIDDDDDLDAAPVGADDTLQTESGWERDNGMGDSSLSYSYSPATVNGSTTRSMMSDGLSPAPADLPLPPIPRGLNQTAPLKSAMKQPEAAPVLALEKPGDWAKADTGVPGMVSSAAFTVLGLFGGSPSPKRVERAKPTTQRMDSGESDASDHSDVSTVKLSTSLDDDDEVPNPNPPASPSRPGSGSGGKPAISAEERVAREAQATSMTMSALSQTLNAHLVASGRGSRARGLKETIEESCAALGVKFSGVLKRDATNCYVILGAVPSQSAAVAPAQKAMPASPAKKARPPSTFMTSEEEEATPCDPGTPPSSSSSSSAVMTPSSNPAAYTIFSPTNPTLAGAKASFHARLQAYYAVHNPAKMDQLDEIIKTFAGREEVLVAKLEKLYKAKVPL